MTWRRWQLTRQLLAEEFVGSPMRRAKAEEDAAAREARKYAQR